MCFYTNCSVFDTRLLYWILKHREEKHLDLDLSVLAAVNDFKIILDSHFMRVVEWILLASSKTVMVLLWMKSPARQKRRNNIYNVSPW